MNTEKTYDLPTAEDVKEYNSSKLDLPTAEDVKNYYKEIDLPTAEDVQKAMDSGEKTGIEFEKDYEEYPYNMKTAIKEYVEYSNPMIRGFVEKVMGGSTKPKDKIYLNNVRERAVNDIKDILGVDVTGYKVALDENTVKHIAKRHGKNGKADSSMANLSDWEKIQYVLEDYDNIEYGGKASGYTTVKENGKTGLADTVTYSKKINGTYYVVEAVPVTNAKTLNVVTAYINKKGAMQVSDVKNPKETSETPSAYTPSTDNIPQPNGIVNNTPPFKVVLTPNVPMHLVDSVNAIKKKTGIDVVFGTAYNADGSINTKYRGEIGNNRIVVSENATKASVYRSVILHELTHGIEGTSLYNDIKNYVINKKYGVNQEQLRADISAKIQQYKNNGVDLTQNGLDAEKGAMAEIVAENVEEYIFAEDVKSIVERDYTFGQKIYDLISELIYNFKKKYNLNVDELASAQRKYRLALDEVKRKGIKSDGGYSIEQFSDGRKYVQATRQVITSDDPLVWGESIENYINKEIRKGNDVSLITDDGNVLTITEDTSGKAKFRNSVERPDGSKTLMTDKEYLTKLNAESHIDEIGKVSKRGKKVVEDYKKHDFAKDGFNYRTAYFRDFDGSYYKLTISVGQNGNINTIYNVGKIKEVPFPLEAQRPDGQAVEEHETSSTTVYHDKSQLSSENKTEMQLAFERAQAKKQYSFVTEEDTETSKFADDSGNEYTRVDEIDDSFGVRILEGKVIELRDNVIDKIENGRVSKIYDLSIKLPCVEKSDVMKLYVTLDCEDLFAENEWELYLFPEVNNIDSDDVLVSSGMMLMNLKRRLSMEKCAYT